MRAAACDATDDRFALKQATGWTQRGKAGLGDKTFLVMEDDGVTIASCATAKVKLVGRWDREAAVAAIAFKRLVAALPAAGKVSRPAAAAKIRSFLFAR
jgi:hypothetical protein